MLISLSVRNFVLIDKITLEFGEGLNVLSGETGAGKSILIDALILVLGGRASPEVVRTGCESAEVEACFEIRKAISLQHRLNEEELLNEDNASELIIRRVISTNGRSKAYINGRLVTATQLNSIMHGWVDISSQHESQTLCDSSTHADMLDRYAHLGTAREQFVQTFSHLSSLTRAIQDVRSQAETSRSRSEFLRFQLQEIEDFNPIPGEDKELETQRARLRYAERLSLLTRQIVDRLDEHEHSILDQVRRISTDLAHASQLDDTLSIHTEILDRIHDELSELARTFTRYSEQIESNPEHLHALEDRWFKLQNLLRKYGPTIEAMLLKKNAIADELHQLDHSDDTLHKLEIEKQQIVQEAIKQAKSISQQRKQYAQKLGDCIASELASLAMGRARIVVDVAPIVSTPSTLPPPPASSNGTNAKVSTEQESYSVEIEPGVYGRLTRLGVDRVELLIAPNPGEEPKPLRKIASGGELSRALLAIKRVLASSTNEAGVYVFDEVDAGVGGAVAEAIGRKIADVATHHQVLCITHLPQIAAFADHHFAVSKHEQNERTFTDIQPVKNRKRIEELARMLGGSTITNTTRRAAEEMINNAQRNRVDEIVATR